MFTTQVAKINEKVFNKATNEKSIQFCQEHEIKTNEIAEIDASNILTIKNEDGTEVNYIPYYDNGQIIMTPITLDDIDENEKSNFITFCAETNDKSINLDLKDANDTLIDHNQLFNDGLIEKESKFIRYGDTVLRPIPETIDTQTKKSTRVAPNTYKKTLTKSEDNENSLRIGRKHLAVDPKIMINAKSFKQQLLNTDDLIKNLELAPRTQRQMRYMIEGYAKLFAYPAHTIMSEKLRDLYTKHCTTQPQPNYENLDDMTLLPVGYQIDVDRSSFKRITRRRRYANANEYKQKKQKLLANVNDVTTVTNVTDVGNEVSNVNKSAPGVECMEIDLEDDNSIRVLLEAANRSSNNYKATSTNNKEANISNAVNSTQLVIKNGGNDQEVRQDGIEVLLAAAESREDDDENEKHYQIILADDNSELDINQSIISNSDSLIIVNSNGHFFIHSSLESIETILP